MIRIAIATLSIDVTVSMVAVITVVGVLVFGLATLARPSAATITWGTAYVMGIFGAYLWMGGYQLDSPLMRAGASSVLFSFEPLVWWGLRAHAARRRVSWPVVAFVVIGPALLLLSAGTVGYPVAFRVFFLAASVFAALIVYELTRLTDVARDITMPLILASTVFVALAVVAAMSTFASGLSPEEQIGILRGTNSTGAIVMSTCAAFTLILLVRADAPLSSHALDGADRLRRRLARAQAHGDDDWSLLDVHLDDPADLREAFTNGAYVEVVARFHADIESALPATAESHDVDETRTIVLLAAGDEETRHHIAVLLARISALDTESTAGTRLSASVGWARAAAFGYDYDRLVDATARAAGEARAAGGGRWVRAAKPSQTSPANLES